MRFIYFLVIFMLLVFDASAYWQTYQNDLRNTGIANGTGYFPVATSNFSNEIYGMDFQPLVDDLDANGNNEIVIFSNDSLIVFDSQLNMLDQAKVGSLLGQPILFNFDNDSLIEIIFNSRQNSTDYFFAYLYNNSNLSQEFNITLNKANHSGIKCLNLDGANSCVFKDERNYVHIVNMSSKIDSSYNTSIYGELRDNVPAIGDIDNDGRSEAVFWFNEDNSSGYGFLVFDLGNRSIKWVVDNIFSPGIAGSDLQFQYFKLKGQPVLVDLNNDNKLEIAASAFYDDDKPSSSTDDWYTELFVFSHNGSKLFSKCGHSGGSDFLGCNDAVSGPRGDHRWEGTNPLVMDYDKNGIDDICFMKDEKIGGFFAYMALNCYNYSGDEIANVNLSNFGEGIRGTAMTADMNNDGYKDVITFSNVNLLNGTSIFSYDFGSLPNAPIAVDIDGNKGLDLVWTSGNQTKVFLDNFNYSADLSVNSFDISFLRFNSSHINISAIIKNIGQVEVNNIKTIIYNSETLENKTTTINIKRNGNFTFSAVLGLKEREKILVSADFDNEINETNEENNFAFKEFMGLPYIFVSMDLFEPSSIQSEFKNYIKNKLASGYYTENENEADIKVYIGKNNPINVVNNIKTLEDFEFGYDFGNIIFNDKIGANPYAALVGAFKDSNGKIIIMIIGNEIEGDIIGAKEFIKNQAMFLNAEDKESVFIDDENLDAIKVYDYLHLGGNKEHYNLNNNEFKKIVKNALNDEMFNEFNYNVTTSNNIVLRLKNLKPNISSDYLEYLNSTGVPVEMPVVLAHGLFSNLTTWEVLGAEISNTGRDTWLIEITGGTGQDCDDCIDYTFHNLTDIFVPALLNGVLSFTGKNNLQYVGFSNGCRSALDSLERNKFDSNKVETFVAVGCPGAFEGESTTGNIIAANNGKVSKRLASKKLNHLSFNDLAIAGLFNIDYISKNNKLKISLNLFKFYEEVIINKNDTQPGNINVPNFFIIQGNAFVSDDGIVTITDEKSIYTNANKNLNPKKHFNVFAIHSSLDEKDRTKSIIKKSLNKEKLSLYEKTINLLNESNV